MTLLQPRATVRSSAALLRRRESAWRALDWWLLLSVAALVVIGTLLIWSATHERTDLTGGDGTAYVSKQVVNVVIGCVLAGLVAATDRRWIRMWAPVIYLGSIVGLALVFVPGVGATVNGSHSWLLLGGMSVQPAEFAKLGLIVGMALVLAERTEGAMRTRVGASDLLVALAIAGVPALMILGQPDLGTLMVLIAIVFGILAMAGVSKRWLIGLVAAAVTVVMAAISTGVLKEYQLLRFEAFTDPSLDPRGAGYNTIQARIAIGNGGTFGEGLFHGSQTQSGFVPEQHTDFVFTVAGEELGLVGAAAIIVLLAVVIWRCLVVARQADDLFGRLAAVGVACWFGFQGFQNIGMSLGIMPVTGVPLPFVSYGGTSLFASLMAVGLLLSIRRRSLRAASSRS